MVLQSLPAYSNVANFTFLWNPLSELRGVKVFCNVKVYAFFLATISPLGRTSYPRSLIKVIAHHSRLGRTFWHLIHGSVTKTAGGVARWKKSGIWKWRITLMLPCHIWQAPLIIVGLYTLYMKRPNCIEITCALPDGKKNPVFHSTCVNLSLFKYLNPCRHAPLSVTDYENWNLKLYGWLDLFMHVKIFIYSFFLSRFLCTALS